MPEESKDAVASGGNVEPESTDGDKTAVEEDEPVFTQAQADAMAGNIKGALNKKIERMQEQIESLKATKKTPDTPAPDDKESDATTNKDAIQLAVREVEERHKQKEVELEQKLESERRRRIRDMATVEIQKTYLAAKGRSDGISIAVDHLLRSGDIQFTIDESNQLVVVDRKGDPVVDTKYGENGTLDVAGAVKKMIDENPLFQQPTAGTDTGLRPGTTSQTPRVTNIADLAKEAKKVGGDWDKLKEMAEAGGLEID